MSDVLVSDNVSGVYLFVLVVVVLGLFVYLFILAFPSAAAYTRLAGL